MYGNNDGGDQGPFQANTRVVAVVALAVAGVFVLLGLILSIARAMQQRTLDRLRADAARAAQGQQTQAILAAGGVVRSSSSKISHLVVGPDGIQLCIAHKERIKAALQPEQKHTIPRDMDQARLQQPPLLSMTASTAGLLANMHQSMLSPSTSHAASSLLQPYGSSDWHISSSPLYDMTVRQQSSSQHHVPVSSVAEAHAARVQSPEEIGAQDYRARHLEDISRRPLFTASLDSNF